MTEWIERQCGKCCKCMQRCGVLGITVKSFYSFKKSKARMKICREERNSFDVTIGLTQECVMSPWLFNLLIYVAIKEWKARIMNACTCLNLRVRKTV